jgi:hypothetical protein
MIAKHEARHTDGASWVRDLPNAWAAVSPRAQVIPSRRQVLTQVTTLPWALVRHSRYLAANMSQMDISASQIVGPAIKSLIWSHLAPLNTTAPLVVWAGAGLLGLPRDTARESVLCPLSHDPNISVHHKLAVNMPRWQHGPRGRPCPG